MQIYATIEEAIAAFGEAIGGERLASALYQPEPSAALSNCYMNVIEKVRRAGGRGLTGWTFHRRDSDEHGPYLFAMHHAVWVTPSGMMVDVTPYDDEQCPHPLRAADGNTLFLVHEAAPPVMINGYTCSPPLRYFPLDDGAGLAALLEERERTERAECEANYEATRQLPPT